MRYLGIESKVLESSAAIHTAREIAQQPEVWIEILEDFKEKSNNLKSFISSNCVDINKIILTGAGTSAFIGRSLKGMFYRTFNAETLSAPTTDLVTHPFDFVNNQDKLLLVSFARSGNSPESTAVAELCDKIASKCVHIIITCNAQGALYSFETKSSKFTVLLPEASNDQSLAMTSSYTGMLLAGILVANYQNTAILEKQVNVLAKFGIEVISNYGDDLADISSKPFDRVVFLGSGPFYGTAREAHLKMLELTGGKVAGTMDSYLGFRHGPKAIVNENTVMVYFLSNNRYVNKYEIDLIKSIREDSNPMWSIAIAPRPFNTGVDTEIVFKGGTNILEELMAVGYILPIQILSFHKSLNSGLAPDKPSVNGVIHRVVQGVKIYSPGRTVNEG
ncbi:MAG: tagatose-6-phosphate ketose isomerase [Cyclobacteriaceae bacterium]|nr:MAG: tagatose-6-phosphate ketose isomerase [Cyclobacteriaceae bacterium]